MKKILAVAVGSALVAALFAADPWKKPWTEWNEKDARRVLQKSPWVVDHYLDQTTVARLTWRSARPVKLALARLAALNNPEMADKAFEQYVNQPVLEQYIAIGLEMWQDRDRMNPQKVIGGREATFELAEKLIRDLVRLHTSDMLKDYVYLQKKDNSRIAVHQFVPPSDGNPQGLLFFPRFDENQQPLFTLQDKEVVLMLELEQIGERIRRRFEFKKMVYEDELQL